MREPCVGCADALPYRLRYDVLADDMTVVGDKKVVGDLSQRRHFLLPLLQVEAFAVLLPGGLQDRQALVDHSQLIRDGLGERGRLRGQGLFGPVADLGTLLGDHGTCNDPDQDDQRERHHPDRAAADLVRCCEGGPLARRNRDELGRLVPRRCGPGPPPAAVLETVAHQCFDPSAETARPAPHRRAHACAGNVLTPALSRQPNLVHSLPRIQRSL